MKKATLMNTAFIILSPVIFLATLALCLILAVVCGGKKDKKNAD